METTVVSVGPQLLFMQHTHHTCICARAGYYDLISIDLNRFVDTFLATDNNRHLPPVTNHTKTFMIRDKKKKHTLDSTRVSLGHALRRYQQNCAIGIGQIATMPLAQCNMQIIVTEE